PRGAAPGAGRLGVRLRRLPGGLPLELQGAHRAGHVPGAGRAGGAGPGRAARAEGGAVPGALRGHGAEPGGPRRVAAERGAGAGEPRRARGPAGPGAGAAGPRLGGARGGRVGGGADPAEGPMTPTTTATNRVGSWAGWALVGALALAALGRYVEHRHEPFWGGLLLAFAEAALVGGLADWFAVRALFGHPFGIPFPHTALIPRNRVRLVRQIRDLVLNGCLPRALLTAKVEAFDSVGRGLLPVVEPMKPHLRSVLREVARNVLDEVSPQHVAGFLARGLAGSVNADKVGPFLGDLTRRAREQRWLEPLLREGVQKPAQWADSPPSPHTI